MTSDLVGARVWPRFADSGYLWVLAAAVGVIAVAVIVAFALRWAIRTLRGFVRSFWPHS